MSFKEIIEKEKNEIITTLIKQGNANRTIDYSQFLSLYAQYKEIMSEEEFASILGIHITTFRRIRDIEGKKAKILKRKTSKEIEEQIRGELLQKGYTNKKIDYQEFLNLYEKYKSDITEQEFARIMGITSYNYNNIKYQTNRRTIVLKTPIDINSIIMEIQEQYGSILIDYNEFLAIYAPYKCQINNENKFAEILGIRRSNFNSMKNKGTRAQILKENYIPEELEQNIIQNILEKGYANRLIGYSEFLFLYEPYKDRLTELQFATALGISELSLRNIRLHRTRAYVLKSKKKIKLERIRTIREELTEQGYANKTIYYSEFKELYRNYEQEMDETQFAEVLGIPYNSYINIKNITSRRANILVTKMVATDVIEKLLDDVNIQKIVGTSINYSRFLELYMPYSKFITETQFAEMIGIPYDHYRNLKSRNHNTKVDNLYGRRLRIKYLIRESRIYMLTEIEALCEKYGISLQEFLMIAFKTEKPDIIEENLEVLRRKGLYIGSKPMDTVIIDKYGEEIIRFIDMKSKAMGHRYRQNSYCDDVSSNTILYITQKRGDLFINFEEQRALQIAKNIASKYIRYSYISHFKLKTISIDKINEEFGDHHTFTRDKRKNVEETVIDNISKRENTDIYQRCINLLQYYYEMGYTNTEAIEKVSVEMNLEKEVMLEMLKKRLMEIKEQKKQQEELQL